MAEEEEAAEYERPPAIKPMELPTAHVSPTGNIIAPPPPAYQGSEMEPAYGEELAGPVHFMKAKPNRMGIQLVMDMDGVQQAVTHNGAAFEPAPSGETVQKPFHARLIKDGFGGPEVAQIVQFRSASGHTMHLFRTDLPEGIMAIQVDGGPIVPNVVIVVQKYQAWEKDFAWKAVCDISEETPWALGGSNFLKAHIENFLRSVRDKYQEG